MADALNEGLRERSPPPEIMMADGARPTEQDTIDLYDLCPE